MRWGLLGAVALVALGCSGPRPDPDEAAMSRLVDPGLGGSLRVVEGATGPMTADLAARSTTLPAATLEPFLAMNGYQAGYSRVWQGGDEFVTALVFRFFAARNATAFRSLVFEHLATSSAFAEFADPAIPGSRGYQLTSDVSGETRFCVGEHFNDDRYAYVVTRCAPFPLSVEAVTSLAARQRAHVSRSS